MTSVYNLSVVQDLTAALNYAIEIIEWTNPVSYQKVEEVISGWPRYQQYARPNKHAQERANNLRKVAGWPVRDYREDFP